MSPPWSRTAWRENASSPWCNPEFVLREKANRFTMDACRWASEDRIEKQEPIWIDASRLRTPVGHPFYERLDHRLLNKRVSILTPESVPVPTRRWDVRGWRPEFTFARCWSAYFEGIDSERGLRGGRRTRWRCDRFCFELNQLRRIIRISHALAA